ncbi:MAG: glycoside hydrolase family 1 protein [Candidatus Doudnabacteria bacterium]
MESSKTETKLNFPPGFLLGAASSAHQSEGNNMNSDWWRAEQAGLVPKSGEAADHYNRYEEDFKIAQEIGLNAMRISIEWARIEPVEGRWDAVAIEHYKKVLKAMKERGLTRMVTLWHWTLPQWLAEKKGFEKKEGVEAFARFTWFVAQNLGAEIDLWVTLNEPEVYCQQAYLSGVFPPFKKSRLVYWQVLGNLAQAHNKAYDAIKSYDPKAKVGIAKNSSYYRAFRKNNFFDRTVVFFADRIGNHYLLKKLISRLDFIGVNYYFYNIVKFDPRHIYQEMNNNFARGQLSLNDQQDRSDMGWVLYPEGIYHLLQDLKKYRLPIYVTENGVADILDSRRPKFIRETLEWVISAIKEGADVRGYFYWALTDNYEWTNGFGPRFGLIEIDYATQKRTVREKSAGVFKEVSIDS